MELLAVSFWRMILHFSMIVDMLLRKLKISLGTGVIMTVKED